MLNILPPELILQVLSFLDLPSLRSVKLLSYAWCAFFAQHSEAIYKSAAFAHAYAAPGMHDPQATAWLDGVVSSEALCLRHWTLQRAWRGSWKAPTQRRLETTGPRARRFTVVPEQRVVIVAQTANWAVEDLDLGDILAVDIAQDRVLWKLPQVPQRRIEACAYDAGFLVLDRERNSGLFEVWRLQRTSEHPHIGPLSGEHVPDTAMTAVHASAWHASHAGTLDFVPHALLRIPEATHSLELVGTKLVLLSRFAVHVLVYDVVTAMLEYTFDCHPNDTAWGKLCAVDLSSGISSPMLVTAVGHSVFGSPPNGELPRQLLSHPSTDYNESARWLVYRVQPIILQDVRGDSDSRLRSLELVRIPDDTFTFDEPGSAIFKVKVSRAGGHLVMLTNGGTLIIAPACLLPVQDPEILSDNKPPRHRHDVHAVRLRASPHCLAFDGHRIAVGNSTGIFITDLSLSGAILLVSAQPRLPHMLRLTPEALWVLDTTWSFLRGTHRGDERDPVVVHYYSFADLDDDEWASPSDRNAAAPTPPLLGRLNAAILDLLGR